MDKSRNDKIENGQPFKSVELLNLSGQPNREIRRNPLFLKPTKVVSKRKVWRCEILILNKEIKFKKIIK